MPNDGSVSDDTPEGSRFIGGLTNGTANSKVLVPLRTAAQAIYPGDAASPEEDTNLNFTLSLNVNASSQFCTTWAPGQGGYMDRGGIVCTLSADQATFLTQLNMMASSNFINTASSAFSVEFTVFNGNKHILTYSLLQFIVKPSGVIERSQRIVSYKLLNFDSFYGSLVPIALRILPGVMYLWLVTVFAWVLYSDLKSDIYRKKVNKGKSWVTSTIEFVTLDIFNALELISIVISLVSAILFIIWLSTESHFSATLAENSLAKLLRLSYRLAGGAIAYNRLSALNMLLIFVRPLKFLRENPRMAKLNQTLAEAKTDITWFVVMFFIAMLGFVMFAHICFGPLLYPCASIGRTFNYCFLYLIGTFDFWVLWQADAVMSLLFFFPYLLLFRCVFMNIFFAIVDRHFVAAEPPPFNIKRKLKPLFQRICRCIEWDEDYVMEQDPNMEKQLGPPSRRGRVHTTAMKIEDIRQNMADNVMSSVSTKSKLLNEVCDVDERMGDVLLWSREEARKLSEQFMRLLSKKQEQKNDEQFIRNDVMGWVRSESEQTLNAMEDAERHMRYATRIHEQMAMRDQETLAKYILLLEGQIERKMIEKHALYMEVYHLRSESEQMRFSKDEQKAITPRSLADMGRDQPRQDRSNASGGAASADGDGADSSSSEDSGSQVGSRAGGSRAGSRAGGSIRGSRAGSRAGSTTGRAGPRSGSAGSHRSQQKAGVTSALLDTLGHS